ncbi:MAG TPA: EAL domain-containing protein [Sporolactobacillaceae bacterium]|nr:EAL domain-containing protein [Sporolactobacillaceae bacterium]
MNVFHHKYRSEKAFISFIRRNQLATSSHIFVLINGGRENETSEMEKWVCTHIPRIIQNESKRYFINNNALEEELVFYCFDEPKEQNDSENHINRKALIKLIEAFGEHNWKLSETLTRGKNEMEALFYYNPNLILALDVEGKVVAINYETEKQLGFGKSDLCERSAIHLIEMGDRERAVKYFGKAQVGHPTSATLEICDRSGRHLPFSITLIPVMFEKQVKGYFAVGINQSAQKEAENKLSHLAYHDALTGLANRFLFEQSLNYLIKRGKEENDQLAVLFLDLDRFKLINDSAGHFVGDRILQQAIERIKGELLPDQLLARFEGDKFSIILPHIQNEEPVEDLARRIHQVFVPPFVFEENEYFLSISIGVSFYPRDGINDEQLMKRADIALYSAKSISQSSVAYYRPNMDVEFNDRVEFESYLRKALKKREFLLYYQPQVSISTGKLTGCEALIRWKHPKLGLVPPVHFIPLAEEIGLIEEIGLWVLETACRQVKVWQEKGLDPFPISINVSFRQFLKKDFVDEVRKIIQAEQIDPKWIHIEITESTTVQDLQYSIGQVKELKRIGVSVSLDDFGTGYSALSVLKDFSLDILKIDRSFIRNLGSDHQDGAIVKAIIMMCQGLQLKTVAEGVETESQLELLKSYGCEVAQGYYYSKPIPSETFEEEYLKAASL